MLDWTYFWSAMWNFFFFWSLILTPILIVSIGFLHRSANLSDKRQPRR
ncbi:hypothetical protein [Nesterenkonia sp. NBAIMH1]|nr:hypothetical protein [Nesterenkonia sp. NBAIMH1]